MSKIIEKEKTEQFQRWLQPTISHSEDISSDGGFGGGPLTAEVIEKIQGDAYKEAYQAGFKKGLTGGKIRADKIIETQVNSLRGIIEHLTKPLSNVDDEVLHQIVDLSALMTRQLFRREIKSDPGQVMAIVREAVMALPIASKTIHIYLHPDDVALMKQQLKSLTEDSHWHLVDDATLSRGDCRLVTESSSVDATVEKRLNALIATMLGGERSSDQNTERNTNSENRNPGNGKN